LERRWLHYAFLSADGARGLIANVAWLGGELVDSSLKTAIILGHDPDDGWSSSQWLGDGPQQAWSSFRVGHADARGGRQFQNAARKGWPSARLKLRRTSTPGVSGSVSFAGDHWQRWQAEPGVLAQGTARTRRGASRPFEGIGYHERVRGCWGWPDLGGWVFGFTNYLVDGVDRPPDWSVVAALLQPEGGAVGQNCVVMIWRRGRLVRLIPRRALKVSIAGTLDRNRVGTFPSQMELLGPCVSPPIPEVMCIDGYQGNDWVRLVFWSRTAARLLVPSETGSGPFCVHEVLGDMEVSLAINGIRSSFLSPAVVEFAGNARAARLNGC
jgi:hypothetical protein